MRTNSVCRTLALGALTAAFLSAVSFGGAYGASMLLKSEADVVVARSDLERAEAILLLDFPVPKELARATIDKAELRLVVEVDGPGGSDVPLLVRPVGAKWSAEDAVWAGGLRVAGEEELPELAVLCDVPAGGSSRMTVDITRIVQAWASGSIEPHGVAVVVLFPETGCLRGLGGKAPEIAVSYSRPRKR